LDKLTIDVQTDYTVMFEEELAEIENRKRATRNLKLSIVAVVLSLSWKEMFFLISGSFFSSGTRLALWLLVILFYGIVAASGIVGIIAFKSSIASLYTFRNYKNYVALGLSVFVLVFLANEILLQV